MNYGKKKKSLYDSMMKRSRGKAVKANAYSNPKKSSKK